MARKPVQASRSTAGTDDTRVMQKNLLGLAVFILLFNGTAQAQLLEVTARLIPGGIELDGGSGPKQFFCEKDRMVGTLKSGGKTYRMTGAFLSIDFGEHLSFEAYDKPRPRLLPAEVRLTCKDGEITVKAGNDIDVTDMDD